MTKEEEYKKIIANNLVSFRKQKGLTQAELAEKLNYSDKSVSKWERAEGTPDVFTLKELSEFFGVSVNDFFKTEPTKIKKKRPIKNEIVIPLLSIGIAWVVIIALFAFGSIFLDSIPNQWLLFVYGFPITGIILIVFMAIYRKQFMLLIGESITIWGVGMSVYFSFLALLPKDKSAMWLTWLICIPIQIAAILYYILKSDNKFKKLFKKHKKEKKEENNEK